MLCVGTFAPGLALSASVLSFVPCVSPLEETEEGAGRFSLFCLLSFSSKFVPVHLTVLSVPSLFCLSICLSLGWEGNGVPVPALIWIPTSLGNPLIPPCSQHGFLDSPSSQGPGTGSAGPREGLEYSLSQRLLWREHSHLSPSRSTSF